MTGDQDRHEYKLDSSEDLELLKAIVAEEEGVELEVVKRDERGFAPVIVIALIGRRKGGQIIDLRDGAAEIARRDKGVVYGLIVIIAGDGKVTVDVKEPKGFFGAVIKDVLDALQGVVAKSIGSVADAATAAAGDRGTVTTEAGATG